MRDARSPVGTVRAEGRGVRRSSESPAASRRGDPLLGDLSRMTNAASAPYRLRVLGTRDLRGPDGTRVSSVLAQPKRLCLLTYLAVASEPVPRSTLAAAFWPDSDEGRARNALSQAVFYLRRSMSRDVVEGVEGDMLWVPRERLWCDARELLSADHPDRELVAAAGRDVMEGWNADDSQPLQEWLDALRREVKRRARVVGEEDGALIAPAPLTDRPSAQPSAAEPRRPDRWRSLVLATAVTAVAVTVSAVLVRASASSEGAAPPARASAPAAWSDRPVIFVTLPSVTVGPAAPSLPPRAIRDEIAAYLHGAFEDRVVTAEYFESAEDVRRVLEGLGDADPAPWTVTVTAVTTAESTRVIGLLYRTPTSELAGSATFDIAHVGRDDPLIEVPRQIGARIGEMVRAALGEPSR